MALDVDNGRVVLRLRGDADTSAATAIDHVLREAVLHSHEARDVEVVLEDVTYLDGRVLGVLLGISSELRAQGRALALVAPSASAARLLGSLGLDRILDVRDREPSGSGAVVETILSPTGGGCG
jgi:anti-anti-sigma factor